MSLYQFAACIDGWNAANDSEGSVSAPSAEEFELAKQRHGDDG